jgi:hypothetical protein
MGRLTLTPETHLRGTRQWTFSPAIDACVDELMRHAINDCYVIDLLTDALSQLFESIREAIGQEFVTLVGGYGLEPTIDH